MKRTVVALALSLPAVAAADASLPLAAEVKAKLTVATDGKGHYVAALPFSRDDDRLFYGDGKTFFSVPVQGGGSQGDVVYSYNFVDPRFPSGYQREFEMREGKPKVTCGEKVTSLTFVDAAAARALVDGAKFEKSPRKWAAYALARDDAGRYFYVDHGRTPESAKNFRLWVGPKGNLKQAKMTNVVSDSEGDMFATKTGSLRLILGKSESSWIEGKNKPKKLLLVPVEDNVKMIYTELGVYTGERLGTPCDDF